MQQGQVLQELVAVVDVAVTLRKHLNKVIPLLVAVDADTVRHVLQKQYSRSPQLQAELGWLRGVGVVVHAGRIADVDNCADGPSRGVALQGDRVRKTVEVLSTLFFETFLV